MKKIFLLLLISFALISCGKKVSNEVAGARLAEAMCSKQGSCLKGSAFAKNLCVQGLKTAYPVAIKHVAGTKVKEDVVTACVQAIQALPCDNYIMAKLPKECTFIKLYTP